MAQPTTLCVEVVDDFITALWTKLAWNLVGSSLSAISDVPVREIGRRPGLRSLAIQLVAECRAVAEREGAHLEGGLVEEMLGAFEGFPPTVRSSMWQDKHAGRPCEQDAISGAMVRAAARHGLATPYAHMATKLLESHSPSKPGSSRDTSATDGSSDAGQNRGSAGAT